MHVSRETKLSQWISSSVNEMSYMYMLYVSDNSHYCVSRKMQKFANIVNL